jgi:hypothetical protein
LIAGFVLLLSIVANSSSGADMASMWYSSIVPVPTFYSPLPTPTPKAKVSEKAKWRFAHDVFDKHDAKKPKDREAGLAESLAVGGTSGGYAPDWTHTSDFMVGRIVVGIILPESNGVISPSVENWDANEISFVTAEINQALQWWTQQAQARQVQVEFIVPSGYPRIVETGYEPIQMIGLEAPFGQAHIWIADVMSHLGYNDPQMTYLQRVEKFDDDLRRAYNADWAITVFAVDAPYVPHDPSAPDPSGMFAPGSWGLPGVSVTAWAHRPGPHQVINRLSGIAQRQEENGLDNIVAHEIGHMFGAADEVWADGSDCGTGGLCNVRFGYLSVENQNCNRTPQCAINRPECVMRAADLDYLCDYSAGQVGWRDSDGDHLADPIDTTPTLSISAYPANPSSSYVLHYSAQVTDVPYPTSQTGYVSVTINTVSVQYRIGIAGTWVTAIPGDGAWDSPYEVNFRIPIFQNGTYTIYLRAINRVGHTSSEVSHTITINSSAPIYRVRLPLVLR